MNYYLFLVSLQKENCRPDGRELTEFRTTTLNIGETSPQCVSVCERDVSVTYIGFLILFPCLGSISTADGSALVKLGNTTIICGIKAVNTFAFPFCCCCFFYLVSVDQVDEYSPISPPTAGANKPYSGGTW